MIRRCVDIVNLIKYVEDAYNDYTGFKKTLKSPETMTGITLERKARSYFLEFGIFLERWKKYMSFRGKEEQFKNLFDEKTHDAFDKSDEYALASMLRNHIAHSTNLMQAQLWGDGFYDVGCNKQILLEDKSFNQTKRDIIIRQPAQHISLSPIMKGSLKELKLIHAAFLQFDLGEEEKQASQVVDSVIRSIKEKGMDHKKWVFVNDKKQFLTIYTPDDKPIETVPATEFHDFIWKEYEPVIMTINSTLETKEMASCK